MTRGRTNLAMHIVKKRTHHQAMCEFTDGGGFVSPRAMKSAKTNPRHLRGNVRRGHHLRGFCIAALSRNKPKLGRLGPTPCGSPVAGGDELGTIIFNSS